MALDRRRSEKGKSWQKTVDHLRMVDPTIPADLAPRKPDRLAARPRSKRSAEDQALIDRLRARQREMPALPRWHAVEDARGVVSFLPADLDEELAIAKTMLALGLTSEAALWTLMHNVLEQCRLEPIAEETVLRPDQIVGLGPDDDLDDAIGWDSPEFDEDRFNRLLGVVASFHPETEIEAQLAYQLALLQDLESEVLALPAESVEQGDQKVNQVLKVMGVKAQVIDRLHKLKQKGVQHVRVDHVIHAIASAADASTPALSTDPRDAVQRTIDQNARRVLGKPRAGPKSGSDPQAKAR
jgi:hypothetical protein